MEGFMNELIAQKIAKKIASAFSIDVNEIEKAIFNVGDLIFINCTPHPLQFDDGTRVDGSTILANILKAFPEEDTIYEDKLTNTIFVKTTFKPVSEGQKLQKLAKDLHIYLVGSIIAANAYGFPVVSPVLTPETARLPPAQKKVYKNKWNCNW